jgi:hypothetical protein
MALRQEVPRRWHLNVMTKVASMLTLLHAIAFELQSQFAALPSMYKFTHIGEAAHTQTMTNNVIASSIP